MKEPRSPLRVGLVAAGLTILVGIVVGAVLFVVIDKPGVDPEARGEMFGRGLGMFALFVGVVAGLIQRSRLQKRP